MGKKNPNTEDRNIRRDKQISGPGDWVWMGVLQTDRETMVDHKL